MKVENESGKLKRYLKKTDEADKKDEYTLHVHLLTALLKLPLLGYGVTAIFYQVLIQLMLQKIYSIASSQQELLS